VEKIGELHTVYAVEQAEVVHLDDSTDVTLSVVDAEVQRLNESHEPHIQLTSQRLETERSVKTPGITAPSGRRL